MEAPLKVLLQAQAPTDLTYRPLIFSLPKDETALRALVKERPGIRISDRLPAQLRELAKSLNPSVKFTEESLQSEVDKLLNKRDLMHYGSWVFYPWNNHLVHLLGETEFGIVRTDRNRNKITRLEQAELTKKKIGVIGLSVGQSVSLTMALERTFGEIRLADFDTLDLSNLNRIRTGVHHLGMNKAVITAREIAEIDPYLRVTCFTDGLTQANIDAFFTEGGQLDILVEECDSVDIKILARQKAKALGIPVVMDMSDRGCLDVERFDLEPDRPIMHGWIDHLDLEAAKRPMSAEEKVPYMLPITGVETLSPRMKASVIELGQTISTWPQLATSVVLGGALAGDAVRRIALDQFHASGRWFVDLEEQVADPPGPAEPEPSRPAPFKLTTAMMEQLNRELGPAPDGALSLDQQTIEQLVQAGGMAPSAGNMQPWKFLWHGDRLLLLHDETRSKSVWDPDHRMALIALGACVENVVLKAHELGLEVKTGICRGFSELAVSFTFHSSPVAGIESHAFDHLSRSIFSRRTDRSIGTGGVIPQETVSMLTEVAASGDLTTVRWVNEPAKLRQLAELHGHAERIRLMHPQGHAEHFGKHLRWNREEANERGDGLDLTGYGLPPMAMAAMKVMADPKAMDLLRSWDGGNALTLMPRLAIGTSAAVALFTIARKDLGHLVAAGRAVQRFWLAAHGANWGVQPMPALTDLLHVAKRSPEMFSPSILGQISVLEQEFHTLFPEDQVPVFLLRLLTPGPAMKPTARRHIQELLLAPSPVAP
jgi:nitroreductase